MQNHKFHLNPVLCVQYFNVPIPMLNSVFNSASFMLRCFQDCTYNCSIPFYCYSAALEFLFLQLMFYLVLLLIQ